MLAKAETRRPVQGLGEYTVVALCETAAGV